MTMVRQTRIVTEQYFPDCEIVICGHFHRSGIWDDRKDDKNLLVINSGSFMPPGAAYWCEWQQGQLRVGKIEKINDHWKRGEIFGLWVMK